MSENSEPKAAEAAVKKPAAPASPILVLGIAAGALIAGAALGMLLVGPQVVAARGGHAAKAKAEEHGEKKGGGHGGGEGEKANFYHLENIIVNPAGSQGSRFLMASVAIELPDSKVEARFKEREVMLRDVVISTLERQTMDALNRPGARDSVRDELVRKLQPMSGSDEPLKIFLPQFVVQ